jgi:hypothetical protein
MEIREQGNMGAMTNGSKTTWEHRHMGANMHESEDMEAR